MLLMREFFGFPIIFAIFGFIYINNVASSKSHDLLSRVLKSNTKPLVVYLKDHHKHHHKHHHNKKREKISLYWLDYLIKATENDSQEEPIDLALRSTCGVASSCAKKCPIRNRKPCVNACSQVFDKGNQCGPVQDKCTSDGICGRTLPPYWRW